MELLFKQQNKKLSTKITGDNENAIKIQMAVHINTCKASYYYHPRNIKHRKYHFSNLVSFARQRLFAVS